MINSTQRTIYGLSLQLHMLTGEQYVPLPNTTLNEKFEIGMDLEIADAEYPTIKYYAIGVGGTEVMDGIGSYTFNNHSPIDAALFQHIPFVMRRVDNDISAADASGYRFKIKQVIDNVEYYCYYLKVIDERYNHFGIHKVVIKDDNNILDHFDTNTDALLNPVPRSDVLDSLQAEDTEYITKSTKLKFSLTLSELEDIEEVIETIYGADSSKAITEIGVCTGIDKEDSEGNIEAGRVQVNFHVAVDINTTVEMNAGIDYIRSIEISGTEPLVL